MEAADVLTAHSSSEMAEPEADAELPPGRPSVTIISTRSGRRTSIHHDTDFADKMNAYIVSPLIPLPKPRLPSQLQPQQRKQQQRERQPRAARRSISCPETETGAASSQRQPQTHQRQLSESHQQRRKQPGRNPTLERLLQPSAREMSRSEQLLDKMRSLKLRIQRHAVQTNCGNVAVADWPPPPDVLLAHAPPVQRAVAAPTTSPTSGADGGGIVCSDSDIRSIIASIQQFEKSVQQNQLAQLIEVISLPPEAPLSPCLASSPNRQQQRQRAARKQVCFIDPKQNRLVMPHHLAGASSTAAAAPVAAGGEAPESSSSPTESPTAAPLYRRSPPPRRKSPPPPPPLPQEGSPRRGSLCGTCHRSFDQRIAPGAPPLPPPPREVSYDENGQTWDVYGADIDPDLLGQAIQTHLAARCNNGRVGTSSESQPRPGDTAAPAAAAPSLNSRKRSGPAALFCCARSRREMEIEPPPEC